MNTCFTIAWFEDDDGWYKATEEEIREYLEGLNFRPTFIRFKSADPSEIEKQCNDKAFDLILADLNLLDEKTTGAQAILSMRELHILADALFYSSKGVEGLQNAMKTGILEGVYTANRNGLIFQEKLKQLINKIVARSEDIINIRGLLMDAVSEYDSKLRETIGKYFTLCDEDEAAEIEEYIYTKITEQARGILKKSEDSKGKGFYLNALKQRHIDSYKLSMVINEIFKRKYPEYAEMKQFHNSYSENILKERNKLAHAKKEPGIGGAFYFEDENGNNTVYNSAKCREIRAHINEYNDLLDVIIDHIK